MSSGRGNVQGGLRARMRGLRVWGALALALVALVGAGLFIRSLRNQQTQNLGFDPDNLVVGNLDLGSLQMNPEGGREFIRQVVAKVHTVPGATLVAVADSAPLGVGLVQTAFREGDPIDSRLGMLAPSPPVSP